MKPINFKRWQIPNEFIENTTCAEIGVQYGHFAKVLIEKNPKHLYLIDPWLSQPTRDHATNRPQSEHNEIFEDVKSIFDGLANCTIIRDTSFNASKQFDDNFFDWVYIDALHDYDSVINDLGYWQSKIKDDGFIWGHDYRGPQLKRKSHVQVNEAITDFCEKSDWSFVAYTSEKKKDKTANSYFLSKSENFQHRISNYF